MNRDKGDDGFEADMTFEDNDNDDDVNSISNKLAW